MPWLSIIVALVSFFLSGGSKPENRAKAAAIGLGVGAATYGITHYTDWGQENLGQLDGVSVTDGDGKTPVVTSPTTGVINPGTASPSTGGSTGFWSALGGAASTPIGAAAVGVAAGSIFGLNPVVLIGGALALILLLKD